MTYNAHRSITYNSVTPFNVSTSATGGVSAQMDTHTAPWVDTNGDFLGKAWVFGSIQSDPVGAAVLCPIAIDEANLNTVREYYGSSFWNVYDGGLVYMDDAVVSYASTVRWVPRSSTYDNNYPLVSADRSRICAVRFEL